MQLSVGRDPVGGSLRFGKPEEVFRRGYYSSFGGASYYDVSSDGRRFFMIESRQSGLLGEPKVRVVLNWFEELEQRVPR